MEEKEYEEFTIEGIENLNEKQRQKMLAKSANSLPNNTSLANLKADIVKSKFYDFVLDKQDSIYAYFNETINAVNEMFSKVKNKINEEFSNIFKSLLDIQNDKQDKLEFDKKAMYGSSNPVTSNGILESILDKTLYDVEFNDFKPTFILKDGTKINVDKSLRGEEGVGIETIYSGESNVSSEYTTTTIGLCKTNGDMKYFNIKVKNGEQGVQGERGAPFEISKTYRSVEDMKLGFENDNLEIGKFVAIVSDVEDEDNAKIYVKEENEYRFLLDLSGAKGIQGEQGVGIENVSLNDDYTLSIYLTNGKIFKTKSIQGESGILVPTNNFISLSVDSNGDLYVHFLDNGDVPQFEYDEETGNLYYVMEVN